MIHLDRFHMDSATGVAWLVVYVATPAVLLFLLIRQLRVAGTDGTRRAPIPSWTRAVLGAQGAIMMTLGVALYVAQPQALWPWTLTPLTAQAIGAWLIGLGVGALVAVLEADWIRIRTSMPSLAVLGVLELAALARYANSVNLNELGIWIYAAFTMSIGFLGVYGTRAAKQAGGEPHGSAAGAA